MLKVHEGGALRVYRSIFFIIHVVLEASDMLFCRLNYLLSFVTRFPALVVYTKHHCYTI